MTAPPRERREGRRATVSEWLESRVPPPPHALAERIRALLGGDADASADEIHDVLAAAAERALRDLIARGDHSRAIAQDLLAIDALVTYACEAAAEAWEKRGVADTDELTDWCEGFTDQLARVGATARSVAAGAASDVLARQHPASLRTPDASPTY